jgi:hypothetical protein
LVKCCTWDEIEGEDEGVAGKRGESAMPMVRCDERLEPPWREYERAST